MGPHPLRRPAAALALLAVLVSMGAPGATSATRPRVELLVGFDRGVSPAAQRALLADAGAAPEERFGRIRGYLASVPAGSRPEAIRALEDDPRVRYAEPNVRFRASATPNDSFFPQLWGLNNTGQSIAGNVGTPDADIDAVEAWDVSTGDRDAIVGVIDTGVDYTHPDLASNIWINPGENCPGCRGDGLDNDGNGYVDDWRGWDFLNEDNDPFDDNGHGTHVAGTVAASGDNGLGVAGVSWSARIMPLKFLGANGSGDAADAVRAVLYADAMGALVTNNSWGGEGFSQALADAIAQADAHGRLFVAAAGNSFSDNDLAENYPSNFESPNVIAVAATNNDDARAWFSNYGRRTVDLGAPGAAIYSTWPGASYRFQDGSSMAAPQVSGALALAKAAFPAATGSGLKALLLRTVDPNASLATRTTTGGRLNVGNALSCAGEPQAWFDAPASGFKGEVGHPVAVRLLAAACGDPDGVLVEATANGQPLQLTARGDGLYTGTYTPSGPGGITLEAQATAGLATDTATVTGSVTQVYDIAVGGPPVTVTTSVPGEDAQLAFDGLAGQRMSLKLTGVTIGSSGCCSSKVSISKPDGTSLLSPTYFGTSGGFVDAKTLPSSGRYLILVDPQSSSTGSATITLYDVPPDALAGITLGGPPVSVETTVPGQNASLQFTGTAGQAVSLKLTDVTMGSSCCSSAKVSLLKPDSGTVGSPANFGTSGGFVDARTLPTTGTYRILLDPQSNAVGGATVTLNDVPPDATAPIVAGGAPVTLATTAPGQDATLTFAGSAGDRVSLRLSDVTIGSSGSTSAQVSILRPGGGTLVSPTYFGTSGGFVDTKTLPTSGTYTILLDPQSSAVGSATTTLYDVPPDVSGSLAIGGSPLAVALDVPGRNARLTFSSTAGQRITLRLTGVTIGTSGSVSSKVSVLNPNGTNLLSPTFFGTNGKTIALTLSATGTHAIVLDPQAAATGSATATLTSP